MKYHVDEDTKVITVEGNPSILHFSEVMNKRFPDNEWKLYDLKIIDPYEVKRYPNDPKIYGDLANRLINHRVIVGPPVRSNSTAANCCASNVQIKVK